MPTQKLQSQLQQLRDQLSQTSTLSEVERASLQALVQDITTRLADSHPAKDQASLVDSLNLAVERFEAEHPSLTGTLRDVMQSLVSMGI